MLVDVTDLPTKVEPSIQTVAEVIDVYLAARGNQFTGKHRQVRLAIDERNEITFQTSCSHRDATLQLYTHDGSAILRLPYSMISFTLMQREAIVELGGCA